MEEIDFHRDRLRFREYPYHPASIFPTGELDPSEVVEVVSNWAPPVVRTRDREFLIISGLYRDELLAFARSHDLPVCSRIDVWDLLLQPFIAHGFSEEEVEDAFGSLEKFGLPRKRVRTLRKRVAPWMQAYNSVHADSCHLGLGDVLDAMKSANTPRHFARFYAEAMDLAALGPRCTVPRRTPLKGEG